MQSQKYLFGLDPCTSWMGVSERGKTPKVGGLGLWMHAEDHLKVTESFLKHKSS